MQSRQAKTRSLWPYLLVLLTLSMGCGNVVEDAAETDASFDDGDLFAEKANGTNVLEDVVANSSVLKRFEALLVATRARSALQSPPYTFFTPWDIAVDKLPYWTRMTKDTGWYGHLRDLLLGHFHQGNLTQEQVKSSTSIVMLNGDTATVSVQQNRPRVDGIRIIGTAAAKDGHAHMLDQVREPKWARRTILDVINADERLSVLERILSHPSLAAKRAELASANVGLTLFAPTDDALAGFDPNKCQDAACTDLLNQFVEDHIVDNLVSRAFTQARQFATQSGARLDWNSATQGVAYTNPDATVQQASLAGFQEVLALNGIVHRIPIVLGSALPIEEGDSFKCDIACGPGTVMSRACLSSTTTRDEGECNEQRAACCVGATQPCPSLCAPGQEFLDDATLRGRTCQDIANGLEAGAHACTTPGIDVRYACCRNTVSSPPIASKPCYDFCGDTRQLVGSRMVPDGSATCWDYSLSISDSSAMCTSADPAIKSACCGELRPPKPERVNYCCLCEGCTGTKRAEHKIGPEGLRCVDLDFKMSSLTRDSAQCSASKEAFRSTCCDPSYVPPPPVSGEVEQVPPCAGPNPPAYCNGKYPACDLCKNGSYPKNPYTYTTIAYISGNPRCQDLYWMGREGSIPPALCYPIQNFLEEGCVCK